MKKLPIIALLLFILSCDEPIVIDEKPELKIEIVMPDSTDVMGDVVEDTIWIPLGSSNIGTP